MRWSQNMPQGSRPGAFSGSKTRLPQTKFLSRSTPKPTHGATSLKTCCCLDTHREKPEAGLFPLNYARGDQTS